MPDVGWHVILYGWSVDGQQRYCRASIQAEDRHHYLILPIKYRPKTEGKLFYLAWVPSNSVAWQRFSLFVSLSTPLVTILFSQDFLSFKIILCSIFWIIFCSIATISLLFGGRTRYNCSHCLLQMFTLPVTTVHIAHYCPLQLFTLPVTTVHTARYNCSHCPLQLFTLPVTTVHTARYNCSHCPYTLQLQFISTAFIRLKKF